ncbi:ParB N-terminal domain-containing protein [Halomonas sp. hl-4]|uniref:ParB N-terminal domain-containing protein n=1 Tax=Halomonas sp. hl-4 TaxID=1761789 RepID=UPI000BC0B1BB|nr:ParB N-terminal domain-containing protein [Halomonas sp. hl-4]SNY95538.1 ParB/RepB/Spo0J family partition protein [Halomonas sp. hl-4]
MREVASVPLRRVNLSESRPTIPDTVNALSRSLEELGLIQPITVRKAPVYDGGIYVDGYMVVAGNHRVAAARALGWEEIEAFVLPGEDRWDEEMREIDENLIRAELTASQRAAAIKRRKALWEQRHPGNRAEQVENQVEQLVPPETGYKKPPPQSKQFAADTAERTGQSKQDINRHVSRADALGDDLDAITGTSLDKGVELDALKSMPKEERAPLIERAKSGEQVSARKPKPAKKTSTAFADMILEKLEIIQRHLDSRDMDMADFERQFFEEHDGGSEALQKRVQDNIELMKSIGMIASTLEG